ncbi:hypothetical protein ACJMK2_035818, partial [Sinanodonta woodiana]
WPTTPLHLLKSRPVHTDKLPLPLSGDCALDRTCRSCNPGLKELYDCFSGSEVHQQLRED